MNRHLVTNWMATALIAQIASRWIEDGTADDLLRWQRAATARRNRLAATLFDGVPHRRTAHGLHLWMPLDGLWTEEAFVAHARHQGVAVAAGSAFAIGNDAATPRGIRVCLGGAGDDALERGLTILSRLARNQPEPALLAV
jgi:DNA-binding transcriptional MocR family regulator